MVDPLITRWPVHSAEEIQAVTDILRAGKTNYWVGREGQAFEVEWARHVGLPHALTVSNGTTALEAALRGVGFGEQPLGHDYTIQPQVIVPARTFMATASAVVHAGGRPVLADIDADSLCVTAETLEAVRTGATVGVIVVHYAGLPIPDMDNIIRWAMRHGLWIIEDCAHAHGASVGRQSHVACWSFCVGKIISTGGEGGMVSCLDDGVAARMRGYRDHGRWQMTGGGDPTLFQYTVEEFGSNLRMTEMQSVMGRIQLRGLAAQVERRREIAGAYDEVLSSVKRGTPQANDRLRSGHAFYMYLLQADDRDRVMNNLLALGVPARRGGEPNIGKEPAFLKRGWLSQCPVADEVGTRVMSLPVYPTMTDAEVDRVCVALRKALA